MLPESMAPVLAHYDEFKEYMAKQDISVRRDYRPETEDWETGEVYPASWQTIIWRETKMPDGRIWVRLLNLSDGHIVRGWVEGWQHQADFFNQIWRQDAEENGFDA